MIIEWAERITPLLPLDVLKVGFEITGDRKRKIVFAAEGEKYTEIFKEIKKS